jgi:hypothetical protein
MLTTAILGCFSFMWFFLHVFFLFYLFLLFFLPHVHWGWSTKNNHVKMLIPGDAFPSVMLDVYLIYWWVTQVSWTFRKTVSHPLIHCLTFIILFEFPWSTTMHDRVVLLWIPVFKKRQGCCHHGPKWSGVKMWDHTSHFLQDFESLHPWQSLAC